MAWVESHTVLGRHRKVVFLAHELNVSIPAAVGHLHLLWHSILEQQEDGDLSQWGDRMIAQMAMWNGDAEVFVSALRKHGLLDGNLVHDWLEYAGRYLLTKYKTSNLSRLHEIWAKHGHIVDGLGPAVQEDSWRILKMKVFERDGNKCRYCHTESGPFEVDHILPISRGGKNRLSNLAVSCRTCNRSKHAKVGIKPKTSSRPPKGVPKDDSSSPTLPNLTLPNPSEPNLTEPEEEKKKSCGKVKTLPAPAKSTDTWEAYAKAYEQRYQVEPKRNERTSSLLCRLVDRLGASDAPSVAAFYLTHNGPMYVRCRHPPNLLVQDAEGLWTQWKTGQKVTTSEVRQAELKDDAREQVKRVEAILARGL